MWQVFRWSGIRSWLDRSFVWWAIWWLLFWWGLSQTTIAYKGIDCLLLWLTVLGLIGCLYTISFRMRNQLLNIGINILLMISSMIIILILYISYLPEQNLLRFIWLFISTQITSMIMLIFFFYRASIVLKDSG